MSIHVFDGDVYGYGLKLPQPTKEINGKLSALHQIEYGQAAAGTSVIDDSSTRSGSRRRCRPSPHERRTGNGEVELGPSTPSYGDDFPAADDVVNGMFAKLSEALFGRGNTGGKTAAGQARDAAAAARPRIAR